DMSGMFSQDPAIFRESVHAFTDAEEFDATVLVLTVHPPDASERLADLVLDARADRLAGLWAAGAVSPPARARVAPAGRRAVEDAERCMRALAACGAVGRPAGAALEPAAIELPAEPATEAEALELLAACGVPVARTVVCESAEAAAAAASALGGAVVVKASAR